MTNDSRKPLPSLGERRFGKIAEHSEGFSLEDAVPFGRMAEDLGQGTLASPGRAEKQASACRAMKALGQPQRLCCDSSSC